MHTGKSCDSYTCKTPAAMRECVTCMHACMHVHASSLKAHTSCKKIAFICVHANTLLSTLNTHCGTTAIHMCTHTHTRRNKHITHTYNQCQNMCASADLYTLCCLSTRVASPVVLVDALALRACWAHKVGPGSIHTRTHDALGAAGALTATLPAGGLNNLLLGLEGDVRGGDAEKGALRTW